MLCRIRENADIFMGSSKNIITPGELVSLDVSELNHIKDGTVRVTKKLSAYDINVSSLEFVQAENLDDIEFLNNLSEKILTHKKLIIVDADIGMCHHTFPTFGDNIFLYSEDGDPEFLDPTLEWMKTEEFAERCIFWKFAMDVAIDSNIKLFKISSYMRTNKKLEIFNEGEFKFVIIEGSVEKLMRDIDVL